MLEQALEVLWLKCAILVGIEEVEPVPNVLSAAADSALELIDGFAVLEDFLTNLVGLLLELAEVLGLLGIALDLVLALLHLELFLSGRHVGGAPCSHLGQLLVSKFLAFALFLLGLIFLAAVLFLLLLGVLDLLGRGTLRLLMQSSIRDLTYNLGEDVVDAGELSLDRRL